MDYKRLWTGRADEVLERITQHIEGHLDDISAYTDALDYCEGLIEDGQECYMLR
ncbi:MAG: hypothetical protein IJ573_10325 [Clostridia bacterium]|nr:hypothetical protein [Clostridia bacterium]